MDDVKPFGPVQLKLVPISVVPEKFNVSPEQIVELADANADGVGLTNTVTSFDESVTGPSLHVVSKI